MSLYEEIKQIDYILEYIDLIGKEAKRMNQEISDIITSLRQDGLRVETADMLHQVYMGTLEDKIDSMIQRMRNKDVVYLEGVKEDLNRALHS